MALTQKLGEEGFRWFLGVVEDVLDPKQLGRVKVRIFEEHDVGVTADDLEWAHVALPTTSAGQLGIGETPGLTVGTRVYGFFMDGQEKQMPVVFAVHPVIPDNDDNLHAISWLARGKNTITKDPIGPEPESPYKAEYPFNKTITSAGGHAIELDDTPENERLHFYHKSGAYIEIDSKGRIVIKSMADSYEIVVQNKEVYIEGNLNIQVKGNVNLQASQVTIDSPQTNITGDVSVDGKIVAQGEVTGKGVNLSTHTHGGVDRGNGSTNRPN